MRTLEKTEQGMNKIMEKSKNEEREPRFARASRAGINKMLNELNAIEQNTNEIMA